MENTLTPKENVPKENETKEDLLKEVGANMRARRLSLNLTQTEIAARTGVALISIKNIEGGRNATLSTFLALCKEYNCLDWLGVLKPKMTFKDRIALAKGHARQRATSPSRFKKENPST